MNACHMQRVCRIANKCNAQLGPQFTRMHHEQLFSLAVRMLCQPTRMAPCATMTWAGMSRPTIKLAIPSSRKLITVLLAYSIVFLVLLCLRSTSKFWSSRGQGSRDSLLDTCAGSSFFDVIRTTPIGIDDFRSKTGARGFVCSSLAGRTSDVLTLSDLRPAASAGIPSSQNESIQFVLDVVNCYYARCDSVTR
jgi:hypothetical protein